MLEIELIVGTMGLTALFQDKLPRYSQALLSRSSDVLKEFERAAKSMSKRSGTGPMPEDDLDFSDYDRLQRMLLEDAEIVTVEEGLSSWPSELQLPLIVQIADVKSYLRNQLPLQQMSGTMAAKALEPSDSDKFRFLWQANLCNDIRRFSSLFTAGAITPIESQLMRTLFPEAHDFFVILVMDQLVQAVADGKADDWSGGWQNNAMSNLLGVPIASFEDVMNWQTGMAEKTAGRPKSNSSIQLAKFNLTDNQKIDTNTLDLS